MREPIVVTGVGAVTPLGVGAAALSERWTAGVCGIADGLGACREFDPGAFMTRKEVRRTPRFGQLALVAAEEALAGAGWSESLPYAADRIGCVIGTGVAAQTTIEEQSEVYRVRGIRAIPPLQLATALGNAAAVSIQLRFGLRGESFGVSGACAAGAQAIGSAIRMLVNDEADAVVVGGAESALSDRVVASLRLMGAGSESGISRPFDRRRDGFVLGEGAGVLVLESAELARRRRGPELARIVGYGASSDAFHVTAPPPDGAGAVTALRNALRDAGIEPRDVLYVNAHGTATLLNDRSETTALKKTFGDYAYEMQISSTKSAVGHLIGAAGAIEAIATIAALNQRVVPPTLALEEPEEGLDLDYVPLHAKPMREPAPGRPRIAISNCFGFGGHNSVLVLSPGSSAVEQQSAVGGTGRVEAISS